MQRYYYNNNINESYTMDDAIERQTYKQEADALHASTISIEERIYEQDLDPLHASVVANISKTISNSDIEWKPWPNKKFQLCKDAALNGFTTVLKPIYFDALIVQMDIVNPSIITLHHAGDIIPLSPCTSCSIYDQDGNKLHQLNYGKKLHLSRSLLNLHVKKGCILYLLWLFKNKEDKGNNKGVKSG
ncbi:hypothetical protein V8C35DRAFT_294231 [Trichoderma chlorosporum]